MRPRSPTSPLVRWFLPLVDWPSVDCLCRGLEPKNRSRQLVARTGLPVAFLALLALPVRAQLGLIGSHFAEPSTPNSRYGAAIALGDIDGDGDLDLAFSRPTWTFDGLANHGDVTVVLHSEAGEPGITINRSNCTGPDDHKANLLFGASLAFGHFNDDAYADLVIGMPGAAVDAAHSAGAVCVWYGAASPVTSARVLFSQGNLIGAPENGDEFGAALAVGDLDGDGWDDLVVGAPGEGVIDGEGVEQHDAGAVHLIRSHALGIGLSTLDNKILHQAQEEATSPEMNERFGAALAVDHFFLSGGSPQTVDLAVGAPGDRNGEGTVTVYSSSPANPVGTAFAPLHPNSLTWDLLGTGVMGDEFGAALVTGDFNGDGGPDLAIGIPGDNDLGTATEAGAVMVLYGTGANGNLQDTNEQLLFEQILDGTTVGVDGFDRFGERLAVADFDLDGYDDLVVGAPLDNSLAVSNSGEVSVIYGSAAGLDVAGHQVFAMVFFDTQQAGDTFGQALAAGARRVGRGPELIVGLPGRSNGGDLDIGGMVFIRNQILFQDGFESGDLAVWSP